MTSNEKTNEEKGQKIFLSYAREDYLVACRIAENLRKLIEAKPVTFERDELVINASICVADFRPGKHKKFEDIFKLSDDALYYSKENGRNCVTFIDGDHPRIYKK